MMGYFHIRILLSSATIWGSLAHEDAAHEREVARAALEEQGVGELDDPQGQQDVPAPQVLDVEELAPHPRGDGERLLPEPQDVGTPRAARAAGVAVHVLRLVGEILELVVRLRDRGVHPVPGDHAPALVAEVFLVDEQQVGAVGSRRAQRLRAEARGELPVALAHDLADRVAVALEGELDQVVAVLPGDGEIPVRIHARAAGAGVPRRVPRRQKGRRRGAVLRRGEVLGENVGGHLPTPPVSTLRGRLTSGFCP